MRHSDVTRGYHGHITVGALKCRYYLECASFNSGTEYRRRGVLTLTDIHDDQVVAKFERDYSCFGDPNIRHDMLAIAKRGF